MKILECTTRTPLAKCPACGAEIDAATSVEGEHAPEEGSLTICIYCVAVSKYDAGLLLIPLAEGELESLPEDIYAYVQGARTALFQAITLRK